MKKKFLSIPAILLLLLLFVFYGTTYATDLTLNEFKNFCVNVGIKNNMTEENAKNWVDNSAAFQYFTTNYEDKFENTNIDLFIYSSGYNVHFVYFNHNNTNKIVTRNKTNIDITLSGTYYGIQMRVNDNTYYSTYRDSSNSTVNNLVNNYYYSELTMYDGWTTTVWKTPDIYYIDNTIFEGPYANQNLVLRFEPETSETNVDVSEFEDIPAYNKPIREDLKLGWLIVPLETTITDFQLTRGYYANNNWNFKSVTSELNNNYIYYEEYDNEINEDNAYEVYFKKDYIQPNNIYIITWWDQTEEPYQTTSGIFYIKTTNTNIVNGTIIPSGDIETEILGQIEENNDFWKETYDKLFTIDSGDAEEIIANFLESSNLGEYGLESGELAILGILNGEPSDFIISWNSVIIPNLKNNEPTTLIPAGSINFSKVEIIIGEDYYTLDPSKLATFQLVIGWVQLILGFAVVLLTIANVWETLMRALGVGVGMYEDNMEEKETLMNIDVDSGEIRTTEIRRVPTQRYTYFLHRKH